LVTVSVSVALLLPGAGSLTGLEKIDAVFARLAPGKFDATARVSW